MQQVSVYRLNYLKIFINLLPVTFLITYAFYAQRTILAFIAMQLTIMLILQLFCYIIRKITIGEKIVLHIIIGKQVFKYSEISSIRISNDKASPIAWKYGIASAYTSISIRFKENSTEDDKNFSISNFKDYESLIRNLKQICPGKGIVVLDERGKTRKKKRH